MGNFTFTVPALGNKFVDYRSRILGDSFNWSWVRPMSQPQYLAIHHSAGPDTQTPDDIAAFHVRSRGWGGVGYHFIISKNGTVYYVGDLTTARANVLNQNHLVIGICLIGNFTEGRVPTNAQLQSTHLLCAHLLFNTPALPNVNGWEDVVGHKRFQATACPGTDWESWRAKIVTGTSPVSGDPARVQEVTRLYQLILGREPDQEGLRHYVSSSMNIDQIAHALAVSPEHQQLISRAKSFQQAKNMVGDGLNLVNQAYQKISEVVKL